MQLLLVLAWITAAEANGGRSLPVGEEQPAVVEKLYSSPRGEVHFVAMPSGHSALLRNPRGGLSHLKELRGPATCDEWLISAKEEEIPRGCDVIFHDEHSGELYSVRSEEMAEGTLFEVARSALRGAVVAL